MRGVGEVRRGAGGCRLEGGRRRWARRARQAVRRDVVAALFEAAGVRAEDGVVVGAAGGVVDQAGVGVARRARGLRGRPERGARGRVPAADTREEATRRLPILWGSVDTDGREIALHHVADGIWFRVIKEQC